VPGEEELRTRRHLPLQTLRVYTGERPRESYQVIKAFNILPQFYGFQPVDEVIRRSRTGVARSGNATGFNPWLFTQTPINAMGGVDKWLKNSAKIPFLPLTYR